MTEEANTSNTTIEEVATATTIEETVSTVEPTVVEDVPIINDNGTIRPMTAAELEEMANIILPDTTPSSIEMRQLRLELFNRGSLTTIDTAVGKLTGDNTPVKIEWEYSIGIPIDGILFQFIAKTLKLKDQDIKDFFKSAATL